MKQFSSESCGLQLIYTCGPVDQNGNIQIGCFRQRLGRLLGAELRDTIDSHLDYIVPIPDSGLYYAMGIAEELGVPYLQALVKCDGTKRTLAEQDLQKRAAVLRDNIQPLSGMLRCKQVALVDEAIFSGTTVKVLCQKLREESAAAIHVLIPTPVCGVPCSDDCMPQRSLLGEHMSVDEMRVWLGADSLHFLPYEKLRRFTDAFQSVCLECFRPPGGSSPQGGEIDRNEE